MFIKSQKHNLIFLKKSPKRLTDKVFSQTNISYNIGPRKSWCTPKNLEKAIGGISEIQSKTVEIPYNSGKYMQDNLRKLLTKAGLRRVTLKSTYLEIRDSWQRKVNEIYTNKNAEDPYNFREKKVRNLFYLATKMQLNKLCKKIALKNGIIQFLDKDNQVICSFSLEIKSQARESFEKQLTIAACLEERKNLIEKTSVAIKKSNEKEKIITKFENNGNFYSIGDSKSKIKPTAKDFYKLTNFQKINIFENSIKDLDTASWSPKRNTYIFDKSKKKVFFKHRNQYNIFPVETSSISKPDVIKGKTKKAVETADRVTIPKASDKKVAKVRRDKEKPRKKSAKKAPQPKLIVPETKDQVDKLALAKDLDSKDVPKNIKDEILKRVSKKEQEKLVRNSRYTRKEIAATKSKKLAQRFIKELEELNKKIENNETCLFVDGAHQKLYIVQKIGDNNFRFTKEFTISTGRRGFGNKKFQTPIGYFHLNAKRGPLENAFGARLKHKVATKTLSKNIKTGKGDGKAMILTSAFGINYRPRPIAFHATNKEDHLGRPDSGGCIRLSNIDIIEVAEILKKQHNQGKTKLAVYISKRKEAPTVKTIVKVAPKIKSSTENIAKVRKRFRKKLEITTQYKTNCFHMNQLPNQPIWFPDNLHITIDDGPKINDGRLDKILTNLEKYDVKATFFFVGKVLNREYKINPNRLKQYLEKIIQRGHKIGYHSYTHTYDKNTKREVLVEIKKFQNILDKALGYRYILKVGRMPGGNHTSKKAVIGAFREMGMEAPKYWHIDTPNWQKATRTKTQEYAQEIKKLNKEGLPHIVLLHEYQSTGRDLDKLLGELKIQHSSIIVAKARKKLPENKD